MPLLLEYVWHVAWRVRLFFSAVRLFDFWPDVRWMECWHVDLAAWWNKSDKSVTVTQSHTLACVFSNCPRCKQTLLVSDFETLTHLALAHHVSVSHRHSAMLASCSLASTGSRV